MPELLIWGAGGHAAVVADIAELSGWTVAALVDETPGQAGAERHGLPVVDLAGARRLADAGVRHAAVAIGNPHARLAKADLLRAWGCELPVLVHPRATVARSAALGEGTVVAAGAVVNPAVRAGRACVVNTLALADHDCELADAVHLCPGVRLAGLVRAGRGAWVGVGSVARDRVRVGDWAYVGAGAVVVGDVPDGALAYGVPARVRGRSPLAPAAAA